MNTDPTAQQPRAATGTAARIGTAARLTLPVVLGYVPVGFAFGVLALKAGIPAWLAVFMSVAVFAGSAQLIAVSLFATGAGPLALIAMTFVVNLRHVLMSAALAPLVRPLSRLSGAWFAFQMTDETFALHATRLRSTTRERAGHELDPTETFAINAMAQAGWVGGSALGVLASGLIADVKPLGLDFALPAMFIALLVAQVTRRTHVCTAVLAGGASVGLAMAGVEHWNVIIATTVAATVGAWLDRWVRFGERAGEEL